jgi:hypothetical protein
MRSSRSKAAAAAAPAPTAGTTSRTSRPGKGRLSADVIAACLGSCVDEEGVCDQEEPGTDGESTSDVEEHRLQQQHRQERSGVLGGGEQGRGEEEEEEEEEEEDALSISGKAIAKRPKKGIQAGRRWSGPSLPPRKWLPDEDERLRLAVTQMGGMNWKEIAGQVRTRNHVQCLQRWKKVLCPGLRKGVWSANEDEILARLVKEDFKNWGALATHLPGRTSKQCRERWCHHLDPRIKRGEFSAEEDDLIMSMQAKHGNRWSLIAQLLPGRTENSIKVRSKALSRGAAGNTTPSKRRKRSSPASSSSAGPKAKRPAEEPFAPVLPKTEEEEEQWPIGDPFHPCSVEMDCHGFDPTQQHSSIPLGAEGAFDLDHTSSLPIPPAPQVVQPGALVPAPPDHYSLLHYPPAPSVSRMSSQELLVQQPPSVLGDLRSLGIEVAAEDPFMFDSLDLTAINISKIFHH